MTAPSLPAPAPPLRAPVGLEGVVLCETRVSHVDGRRGRYRYRDHDAVELARTRTLEDVWHLLLEGELPERERAAAFRARLGELRVLPLELERALTAAFAPRAADDPMAALRTAVSLLGDVLAWPAMIDLDEREVHVQAVRTCALLPTLVAALHRLATRRPIVAPDPALGQAAAFLQMLHGRPPEPAHARALEQYMILAADHGMAASTFAGRVIASTGADFAAAITGAIGALGGPLHGGAPDRALEMLDAIGTPAGTDPWLRDCLARGERVMGFGHRVYRAPDPRARMLRELAARLDSPRIALAEHVESRATALLEQVKPGHDLRVNVEFYAAVTMEQVGVPPSLFGSTFAIARSPGWSAHIIEQIRDNRLIRPLTEFAGGPLRPVPEGDL
jgi:citrate synthase